MVPIGLPWEPASVPGDHAQFRYVAVVDDGWPPHTRWLVLICVGLGLLFGLALTSAVRSCAGALDFSANDGPAQRSTLIGIDARDGRTRWTYETEGDGELAASATSHGVVAIRTRGGDLDLVRVADGHRFWEVALDDIRASRPVLIDRTVVILTADRTLHAYDLRGRRRWAVPHAVEGVRARRRGPDLPSDFDERDSFGISATEGVVAALGNHDGALHAYDLRTGAPKWTSPVGSLAATIPVAGKGVVVVNDVGSRLHAFDIATGVERWRYTGAADRAARCRADFKNAMQTLTTTAPSTTTPSTTVPTTAPTLSTTSTTFPLRRFDHLLRRCGGAFFGGSRPSDVPPPVIDGDAILNFDLIDGVDAIDTTSGAVLWRARLGFVAGAPRANAVISRDFRAVTRRDARTGAVQWRFDRYTHGEFVVAGDEVVAAFGTRVLGLDLATGHQRWYQLVGDSQSTPIGASGKIVVLSK